MSTTFASRTAQGPRSKGDEPLELHRLVSRLRDISSSNDEAEALADVVRLTKQLTNAFGVGYLLRNESGQLNLSPNASHPADFLQIETHRTHLFRVATIACSERAAQVAKLEAASPMAAFAIPVFRDQGPPEAIAGIVNAEADPSRVVATTLLIGQLVAGYVSIWRGRLQHFDATDRTARSIDFLRQLTASPKGDSLRADAKLLADAISQHFDCQAVAIGTKRRSSCRLLAVSGQQTFDSQSPFARQIESVMDEALLEDVTLTADTAGRSARSDLSRVWNTARIDSFGLSANDKVSGACVIVRDDELGTEDADLLRSILPNVGARLNLLQQAHQSAWRRVASRVFGDRSWLRKPTVWMILAGCLLAMAVPVPYKVSCPCRVEPVQRRYVDVPVAERLDRVFVKPGDVVRKGQSIAVMDGSEIRLELASLRAEAARAEKQRSAFVAGQDRASAQLAELEVQQLESAIALLEQREANLEVKSPIDGIVISGDPQKIEGARLNKGEKLIEVAPLEKMLIELEIPEDDILHVRRSQKVRFRLHSDPLQVHTGTLEQLHPRSEQIDSKNVFVGEVPVDNQNGALRPGMIGKARVIGARRSLGWNLFHKPWNKLMFHLGW